MAAQKYVAYYRVSTQKQGRSGLGLEAQKATVQVHLHGKDAELVAEYTDVETGSSDFRPELTKAIEKVSRIGGILIIAKLDRLSRKVSFISKLMDSEVRFVCCDFPEATEFTIHIFAAIAQYERKMTSDRTKAAMNALKARGTILGNPRFMSDPKWMANNRKKGRMSQKIDSLLNDNLRKAYPLATMLRAEGLSMAKIADALNRSGFVSAEGCPFSFQHVFNLLKKPDLLKSKEEILAKYRPV